MTATAKVLYAILAGLTIVTIAVSLQPSVALRQVRNLTIFASYGVGVALLFSDGWLRPALIWTSIGLISGVLYFGYEAWSIAKAHRQNAAEDPGSASLSTVLLGVVAWPLALPEVIEASLADLGVIGSGEPKVPAGEETKEE